MQLMRGLTRLAAVAALWLPTACATPSAQQATSVGPTAPKAGETFRDAPWAPEMTVIPAGSFMMGTDEAFAQADRIPQQFRAWERPVHEVTIARPFAVGTTEVTRGQYRAFVEDSGYDAGGDCRVWNFEKGAWDVRADKNWADAGYPQTDDHPVVCIDWAGAKAYVDWLAKKTGKPYRLLSEAEFEYAALGGQTFPRFWGASLRTACDYANIQDLTAQKAFMGAGGNDVPWDNFQCEDGYLFSAPVKSFRPNGYGLYDIIGNAVEWLADCEHESFDGAPIDGSAWMTGPCTAHLERGGSWIAPPWVARASRRHWTASTWKMNLMTVRVALSL